MKKASFGTLLLAVTVAASGVLGGCSFPVGGQTSVSEAASGAAAGEEEEATGSSTEEEQEPEASSSVSVQSESEVITASSDDTEEEAPEVTESDADPEGEQEQDKQEEQEERAAIPESSREDSEPGVIPEELIGIEAGTNYSFPVVIPSFLSLYWQGALRGMDQAAAELDVRYQAQVPEEESTVTDSLSEAMEKDPWAIALSLSDGSVPITQLWACRDRGIPVVAMGRVTDSEILSALSSTIQTGYYAAGVTAAERLYPVVESRMEELEDKSKAFPVGILLEDTEEAAESAEGFETRMKELGGDKVAITVRKGNTEADANALIKDDGILAAYATGVTSTESLIESRRYVKQVVSSVGTGSSQTIRDRVASGYMVGCLTESPLLMGYYTLYTMTALANGEAVPEKIYVESCWYDAENMNDPDVLPNL